MEGLYHLIVCLVCFFAVLPQKSLSDGKKTFTDNTVNMRFDKNDGELLLLEEWTATETANFQDITVDGLNTECVGGANGCPSNVTFVRKDVMLGEIKNYNGDMRFDVYVSTGGKSVLSKSILADAVTNSMDGYKEGLSSSEDYSITLIYVDGVRVAEPVDNSMNIILSVVSVVLLLAFCFLALVLKCKENMSAKAKLDAADGHATAVTTNDGEEALTLTAIKSADEEVKEPSEAQPMI